MEGGTKRDDADWTGLESPTEKVAWTCGSLCEYERAETEEAEEDEERKYGEAVKDRRRLESALRAALKENT